MTLSTFILLLLQLPLAEGSSELQVPILLYHRFGPVASDNMTVTTMVFESHIKYLTDNGYTVIPLKKLVDYYLGKKPPPPPRSVVITVDDGHKSVFTELFPLVRRYHIPVTLFLYPSAISNAPYAMTWEQLREMKETGFFDFQSHTYWHPNFKNEKKRLRPLEYERFVEMQLKRSKDKLEEEIGVKVDMLAWPFGIYDDELIAKARDVGYVAAFTMVRHHTSTSDNIMALPRYRMTNADMGKVFERILASRNP